MLVLFSSIFVADTKIIFLYDFVAPDTFCLKYDFSLHTQIHTPKEINDDI